MMRLGWAGCQLALRNVNADSCRKSRGGFLIPFGLRGSGQPVSALKKRAGRSSDLSAPHNPS